MPAFPRHSDRRLAAFLLTCLIGLGPVAGCRRQPDKPLELELTLVKTRLKTHDALWYVLAAKNVGRKQLSIYDDFLRDQHFLSLNNFTRMGTRLEILGPDARPLESSFMALGDHGEFDYWTNDTSSYTTTLKPGEAVQATPSIISSVRGNPAKDWRAGPPGAPPGRWLQSLKRGQLRGRETDLPEWARVPFERPPWAPANARILQGFDFDRPGRYRIRAVFDWLSPATVQNTLRDPKRLTSMGIPEETRVFHYESPWLEFEVVA